MLRRKIPIALLLALLAAPPAAVGAASCPAIRVTAPPLLFADGFESGDLSAWTSGVPRFPATKVVDLDIEVSVAGKIAPGELLHVRVLTPRGHHYQTLDLPIAPPVDPVHNELAAVPERQALQGTEGKRLLGVASYPRPLEVQEGRRGRARGQPVHVFTVRLPVAGTLIVQNGLYGRWRAEAALGSARGASCGPPAGFEIVP